MKREDLNGWYVVDESYHKYVKITNKTGVMPDDDFEDSWNKPPYIEVSEKNKHVIVVYGAIYCHAFKNKKDAETFLIGHILKTCATQEFCAQYIENVKKFGDSKYYDLFNACLPEKRAEYDKQSKWRDKKRNWVDKVEKMSPIMQLHAIYELINPCPK